MRIGATSLAIMLFAAACSKGGNDAAEQEIAKNPQSDAELAKQARKIESTAEESVKKVEAAAKAEIDATKAEAKEGEQQPESKPEEKKAAD